MKVRIVKRTGVDGKVTFVIQVRNRWLPPWWWVDAIDDLPSLEMAREKTCYFDGRKPRDEVVG